MSGSTGKAYIVKSLQRRHGPPAGDRGENLGRGHSRLTNHGDPFLERLRTQMQDRIRRQMEHSAKDSEGKLQAILHHNKRRLGNNKDRKCAHRRSVAGLRAKQHGNADARLLQLSGRKCSRLHLLSTGQGQAQDVHCTQSPVIRAAQRH